MPSYTIRDTRPTGNLPYYTSTQGSITPAWNTCILGNYQGLWYPQSQGQPGANVLNNCTGYSQGRMMEMWNDLYPNNQITSLATNPFSFLNGNAYEWYQDAIDHGLNVGSVPQIGAVGVWKKDAMNGEEPLGHVANIECNDNGTWRISEGHAYYDHGLHNNSWGSWDYSFLQPNVDYLPSFIGADPNWYLLGFIYPFDVIPDPPQPPHPPHPTKKKKMPVYMMIKYYRNY